MQENKIMNKRLSLAVPHSDLKLKKNYTPPKKELPPPLKKCFDLPTSLNEDNPKTKMASTMKMTSTPKLGTCNNVRCIIYYLKKLLMTPHLDRHSTTDPKPEMISAV